MSLNFYGVEMCGFLSNHDFDGAKIIRSHTRRTWQNCSNI